jgi:protein NrfD
VTNRPIWSDTPLLGMLFVISAASTSAALMTLLAHRSALTLPGLADLHRMETWVVALELVVFTAVVVSLGRVLSAWMNGWGLLLLIVVALGMVAPLYLAWRKGPSMSTSAIMVLIAGLLLRVVIVFSSEGV